MSLRPAASLFAAVLALALAGTLVAPAHAAMRSELISRHLCKTTGGGKFVDIPGFPGERIDRRLLRDIRWMKRRYRIFITDGYATSGHAPNGEHPIGLAADIVPHPNGGRWGLITDLAKKFEPEQNRVRPPMRWVGYNGDAGHGRGHHLHLSWMHSPTQPRDPARVVYTRKCPRDPDDGGQSSGADTRGGGGGTGSGGVSARGSGGDGGGSGSGGVQSRKSGTLTPAEWAQLAPVVAETG